MYLDRVHLAIHRVSGKYVSGNTLGVFRNIYYRVSLNRVHLAMHKVYVDITCIWRECILQCVGYLGNMYLAIHWVYRAIHRVCLNRMYLVMHGVYLNRIS